MKFNTAKPFIFEILTLFGCSIFIILVTYYNGEIRIIHNFDNATLIAIILVIIWFLYTFVRVVRWGFTTLIDYLFQNIEEKECTFLDINPYMASIFSDKNRNEPHKLGMFYIVQMIIDKKTYTFISPSYLDLEKGGKYSVRYGKLSKVLCEIVKKEYHFGGKNPEQINLCGK